MGEIDRVPRIDPDRPREFAQSGREVDYFVFVVCTDRGQHKSTLLTTARRELDGGRGMNNALRFFAPPMGDAEPHSLTSRSSYVFRCPRCPHTPQVEAGRWWELLDAVVRFGLIGATDAAIDAAKAIALGAVSACAWIWTRRRAVPADGYEGYQAARNN